MKKDHPVLCKKCLGVNMKEKMIRSLLVEFDPGININRYSKNSFWNYIFDLGYATVKTDLLQYLTNY
jgi:hypothetical protein